MGNKRSNPVCPDCKTEFVVNADSEVGEIIDCSNCGAEIELLSLNPLKFEILEEEK